MNLIIRGNKKYFDTAFQLGLQYHGKLGKTGVFYSSSLEPVTYWIRPIKDGLSVLIIEKHNQTNIL